MKNGKSSKNIQEENINVIISDNNKNALIKKENDIEEGTNTDKKNKSDKNEDNDKKDFLNNNQNNNKIIELINNINNIKGNLNIKENEKEYELTIEKKKKKKENVNAELKDGYLIINATNEKNEEEKDEKGYIRKERYVGSCSRSFFVGKNLKEEDIKAKFDNGVLTLNVPKEVEKRPEEKKYIAIEG